MAVIGGKPKAAHHAGQVSHALLKPDFEALDVGAACIDRLSDQYPRTRWDVRETGRGVELLGGDGIGQVLIKVAELEQSGVAETTLVEGVVVVCLLGLQVRISDRDGNRRLVERGLGD